MLHRTVRGQGAFHALVRGHDGFDIGPEVLAGLRQEAQGVQDGETFLRAGGEGGVQLIAGSVTAVVRDVERLEALRGRGVHDRVELVDVHVVGSTVGGFGEESHDVFLCGRAQAGGQQKEDGEYFFHAGYYIWCYYLTGTSLISYRRGQFLPVR